MKRGIRSNIIRPNYKLEKWLMEEMAKITDGMTADYWHIIEPIFAHGLPDPDVVTTALQAQYAATTASTDKNCPQWLAYWRKNQ